MGAIEPGALLGSRFEVVAALGSGGLAEVFSARDRATGSEVALKALHPHYAQVAVVRERFRREVAIARRLDHPGIVRVYDLHEHEGRPFISMELLSGQPLSQRIRESPLPVALARRVAQEICLALGAAHRAGVVHRDLKPQNVFLAQDGAVKVLDFGLARMRGQSPLTASSAAMGTPGYIAPEVLAGEPADARSDIYSLGATFYEMLTARRAFGASDPVEVARQQREPLPSARAFNQDVGEAEEAILRRALAPDPERRFLDCGQFLRALAGEPVPGPPASPPPMTSGEFDVLVFALFSPAAILRRQRRLDSVLERLGARAERGWRLRTSCAGRAVLVAGASRRTAETALAICAEQGLPATIRPGARRSRVQLWLSRHGGPFAAVVGLFIGAALTWALQIEGPFGWAAVAGSSFVAYALSWGFVPEIERAPVQRLPERQSAIRRLADGIVRRADLLRRRRVRDAPVLEELIRTAGDAADVADRVFADSVLLPSPVGGSDAADDLPAFTAVDQLTTRLLAIATALDDALALADAPSPAPEATAAMLRALQENVATARDTLPEIRVRRAPAPGS